jgi:hypothetical protein
LFTVIGGKFKFQVQDSFWNIFMLAIGRFEKHIALSGKKATFTTTLFYISNPFQL